MLALTVNLAEIHTGLSRRYFQLYLLSRSIDTSISGNPAISSVSVSVSPRSLLLPHCLLLQELATATVKNKNSYGNKKIGSNQSVGSLYSGFFRFYL